MNSLKLLGRIAWIYSTLISIPIRGLHELVIRNIPDRSSVLDIGCGPGLLDVELQLRDNKVTCVDALIPMAKISTRRESMWQLEALRCFLYGPHHLM